MIFSTHIYSHCDTQKICLAALYSVVISQGFVYSFFFIPSLVLIFSLCMAPAGFRYLSVAVLHSLYCYDVPSLASMSACFVGGILHFFKRSGCASIFSALVSCTIFICRRSWSRVCE